MKNDTDKFHIEMDLSIEQLDLILTALDSYRYVTANVSSYEENMHLGKLMRDFTDQLPKEYLEEL